MKLLTLAAVIAAAGALTNPLQRIRKDYMALSVRASPRHVMRPRTDDGRRQCAAIAAKIANATRSGEFVVDVFESAARKYSVDDTTASNGGLLGERIPQGTIRSKALDRHCFTAELGQVEGPYESEFGWHLVLVPERLNCFKDDGYTRIEPRPMVEGGAEGLVRSVRVRGEDTEQAMADEAAAKTLQTLAASLLLCGFVAEGAAALGSALEAFS